MSTVNIKGIPKAKLLAGLYNNSKAIGLGIKQFTEENLSEKEAQQIIDVMKEHNLGLEFKYLKGRVMNIDISKNEINTYAYDRDIGKGTVQSIVDEIRANQKPAFNLFKMAGSFVKCLTRDSIGDAIGWSGFTKEKKTIKDYAFCEVTRAQYDGYKNEVKIHKQFNKNKRDEYYGVGIPMEISSGELMADILCSLAEQKVVFEKGYCAEPHGIVEFPDMLQHKLERYAHKNLMTNYHWDNKLICEPYMSRLKNYKNEMQNTLPAHYFN